MRCIPRCIAFAALTRLALRRRRPSQARLTPAQALAHPWIHSASDAPMGGEVLTRMKQFASQEKFRKLGLLARNPLPAARL